MVRTLALIGAIFAAPAIAADHVATGSFDVAMTKVSETQLDMAKTYTGGMAGKGSGPFVGDAKVMVYVALETFDGTLDGRKGGFIMMHRGYQTAARENKLDIAIAPNSGTGELAGISGALDIRIDEAGRHFYTLRYALPGK